MSFSLEELFITQIWLYLSCIERSNIAWQDSFEWLQKLVAALARQSGDHVQSFAWNTIRWTSYFASC